MKRVCVVVGVFLLMSDLAVAQPLPTPDREGMFPDASFDLTWRIYTPSDNPFSPFYAWDGDLDLQATVFRRASTSIDVRSMMQAVGTESFGRTIGVAAAGYLIGIAYVHRHAGETTFSAGFTHVSSHLTRDLDSKVDDQRRDGIPIPVARDPDQFNILFISAKRRFRSVPFTPEIGAAIQPVSFRFSDQPGAYVRPLYVATRWTLWQRSQILLVTETQHEIGRNAFSRFSLSVELYPRDQPEGRLQVFVNLSPGRGFHVSPTVGAVRDGIAAGVRVKFRT